MIYSCVPKTKLDVLGTLLKVSTVYEMISSFTWVSCLIVE
jgi:hypothetical protein